MNDPAHIVTVSFQLYEKAQQRLPKNWSRISELVMKVRLYNRMIVSASHLALDQIGQMQIIRRLIAYELKTSCEYDSKVLSRYTSRSLSSIHLSSEPQLS